jgi:hypothetical protein
MVPTKSLLRAELQQAIWNNRANHTHIERFLREEFEATKERMVEASPEQLVGLQAEARVYRKVLSLITRPPLKEQLAKSNFPIADISA